MKPNCKLLLAGLVSLIFVGAGIAAPDYASYEVDYEFGNDSKGQYIWRQNCRLVCHDGEHGNGPMLSPMDKLMEDWEVIANNVGSIKCLADWPDTLSEDDLSDIFSYLYNGAADSPTPVT